MLGTIRLRLIAEDATLTGRATCNLIDETERKLVLARIGADPIQADSRPARVIESITAKKRANRRGADG